LCLKTEYGNDKETTRLLDLPSKEKTVNAFRCDKENTLDSQTDDKPDFLESVILRYATIDVSPRVSAANVRSVCTAFYVSFREGWPHLCLSPLLTASHTFSRRGCLWVYYTTDLVRSATHTRARDKYVQASVWFSSCARVCEGPSVRIGRVRVLPSRTTTSGVYNACGTIKKYPWSENKSNLGAERLADRPRSLNAR